MSEAERVSASSGHRVSRRANKIMGYFLRVPKLTNKQVTLFFIPSLSLPSSCSLFLPISCQLPFLPLIFFLSTLSSTDLLPFFLMYFSSCNLSSPCIQIPFSFTRFSFFSFPFRSLPLPFFSVFLYFSPYFSSCSSFPLPFSFPVHRFPSFFLSTFFTSPPYLSSGKFSPPLLSLPLPNFPVSPLPFTLSFPFLPSPFPLHLSSH